MSDLSISIALCTYNGSRFLREQLASLGEQQRRPQELVVVDDGSVDDTLEIVKSFAAGAPFPVRVYANPSNLGSTKNFERAINLCVGDVIALCDQDDVWSRRKLKVIADAFRDKAISYVFSDAELINESSKPTREQLWRAVGFGSSEQTRFQASGGLPTLIRRNVVTGATMAFCSRYKSIVLPISKDWVHDGWIAVLLSAVSKGTPLTESLVQYRRHTSQQIGEKERGWVEQYRLAKQQDQEYFARQLAAYFEVIKRLESQAQFEPHPYTLPLLREKAAHCEHRSILREKSSWRAPSVIRSWLRGDYFRLDRGWKAAVQDLII